MKLPLAAQLELDTFLANRSPISQLPYLGPKIKVSKPTNKVHPCPSVAKKFTLVHNTDSTCNTRPPRS
jgi:hypothetical protein